MSLTKTQREKAARMWAQDETMRAIADELGVTFDEINYEIRWHREMYPRRYRQRVERMDEYVTVWVDDLPDLKRGEPIVRCRDCEYFEPDGEPSEVYPDRHWCDKLTVYMSPDGFCSFGKRKEVRDD